jgi:hypothetical protein
VVTAGGSVLLLVFVGLAHLFGVREIAQIATQLARKVRRSNAN